jgi:hypothetical protein
LAGVGGDCAGLIFGLFGGKDGGERVGGCIKFSVGVEVGHLGHHLINRIRVVGRQGVLRLLGKVDFACFWGSVRWCVAISAVI